jgi:ADP-ribose pyrophosphatase
MTKLLSRKPVFEHPIFTVSEDELRFPDGVERTHHTVQRLPGAYIFPVDKNLNIYLVEQYRYLHEVTSLESIAGLVEKGEEPLEGAKRELKEESGITAQKWTKLGNFKPAGSIMTWDQHMYLAQDLKFGDQELEDTEKIDVIKLPLDEAVEKVFSNEIIVSSTAIGILMIDKMRQEGKL